MPSSSGSSSLSAEAPNAAQHPVQQAHRGTPLPNSGPPQTSLAAKSPQSTSSSGSGSGSSSLSGEAPKTVQSPAQPYPTTPIQNSLPPPTTTTKESISSSLNESSSGSGSSSSPGLEPSSEKHGSSPATNPPQNNVLPMSPSAQQTNAPESRPSTAQPVKRSQNKRVKIQSQSQQQAPIRPKQAQAPASDPCAAGAYNSYYTEQREPPSLENPAKYTENIEFLQENLFNMDHWNEKLKETRMLLFGDLIQYPPPPPPPPECHCKEVWAEMEKKHVTNCDCGMENCGCECCGCDLKTKPPTIVDREELSKKIQSYKKERGSGSSGSSDTKESGHSDIKTVGKVEVETSSPPPVSFLQKTETEIVTRGSIDINNNFKINDANKMKEACVEKRIKETKKIQFQLPPDGGVFMRRNQTRVETCFMAKVDHKKATSQRAKGQGGAHTNTGASGRTASGGRGANSRPAKRQHGGGGASGRRRRGSRDCHKRVRSVCCCSEEESETSSEDDSDGCCEFPSQFLWFILQMNSTAQYYKSQVAYQGYFQQQLQDQAALEDGCGSESEGQSGREEETHRRSVDSTGSDKQPQVTRVDVSCLDDIVGMQGEGALINKEVALTLRPFNPHKAGALPGNPIIDMKSLRLFAHGEKEQAECCCDKNNNGCGSGRCTNERGCCGRKRDDNGGGEENRCCPIAPPQPPCCSMSPCSGTPVPQQQEQRPYFPCTSGPSFSPPVCQVPFTPPCYSPPPPYPCYPGCAPPPAPVAMYPSPYPCCFPPQPIPYCGVPCMTPPCLPCYPPCFPSPLAMMAMCSAMAGGMGGNAMNQPYGNDEGVWDGDGMENGECLEDEGPYGNSRKGLMGHGSGAHGLNGGREDRRRSDGGGSANSQHRRGSGSSGRSRGSDGHRNHDGHRNGDGHRNSDGYRNGDGHRNGDGQHGYGHNNRGGNGNENLMANGSGFEGGYQRTSNINLKIVRGDSKRK